MTLETTKHILRDISRSKEVLDALRAFESDALESIHEGLAKMVREWEWMPESLTYERDPDARAFSGTRDGWYIDDKPAIFISFWIDGDEDHPDGVWELFGNASTEDYGAFAGIWASPVVERVHGKAGKELVVEHLGAEAETRGFARDVSANQRAMFYKKVYLSPEEVARAIESDDWSTALQPIGDVWQEAVKMLPSVDALARAARARLR